MLSHKLAVHHHLIRPIHRQGGACSEQMTPGDRHISVATSGRWLLGENDSTEAHTLGIGVTDR